MELSGIFATIGFLLLGIGAAMLLPLGVSLFYQEPVWNAFLAGALLTWLIGGVIFYLFRQREPKPLRTREGLAVVGLTWMSAAVMCSLPLAFSGEFASFTDALFEACSGLSSTGATIMRDVESASHGVLFWRAMTHWLGGMGFIVLSLAVFPFLGLGGMQLYKSEIPSPNPERLQPRTKDTASMLWRLYFGFTLLAWLVYWLAGMGSFDAVCHAMSTLATGGFSTKNASIGAFNSPLIEWVATFFMIVAGINYALYFWLARRKPMWRDLEARCYLALILLCSLSIALVLALGGHEAPGDALRGAFFHVASLVSTTGFSTRDYIQWPSAALVFLLLVMLSGGSAGSTSGGPKILRWIIAFKFLAGELKQVVHPRSVFALKVNNQSVDREILNAVCAFLGLYLLSVFATTLALTLMGLNLASAVSAGLACLGNIGPGLGDVGPYTTYADLSAPAKWLLCLAMIMGRLELFPILALFIPSFWRH